MYDIIIVGAGPAGLSAAIYGVRSGKTVLVLEKSSYGGQIINTPEIENYPGIKNVSGYDFATNLYEQAKDLGAKVVYEEVTGIECLDNKKVVKTNKNSYDCHTVILATGAKRNPITLKEAKKYEGNGISYCAVCDGFFFRNKNVGILGNGDYALHEAKVLEPLAKAVTIFTNGLTETFDSSVLGNIQVNHKKLLSVGGENSLEWITFEDGSKLNIDGLFVALGSAGSTDIAKKLGLILKDNHIMIETDTSTMLPGFFAAGDCTGGMMQIAKAVYEGAQAGTKAVKFIKNTK